ncbi:MAG: hypothetical protein OEW00_12410, partial [candidate division Zixibacteria bacterium]|nr:hypothetical protein [candidate division Zixibacteria bacterium]
MNKKLARYTIVVIPALAFLVLLSSTAPADDLVFRNDFICYDTLNTECFNRNAWNDVSLDSVGNISQINSTSLYPGALSFYQFNRFDRYGDQALPVDNFMPDTLCLDTIWGVTSRIHCYTNEGGQTATTGVANFVPGSNYPQDSRTVAFRFDKDGSELGHPVCFDCDIPYTFCDGPYLASGDVSSAGVIGAVWSAYHVGYPNDDSLYVRLYYPDGDSLGRRLGVYELPAAMEYNWVRLQPRMGLADDNSLVVAWISGNSDYTFFAIYNADGSPRTDIMQADSLGGEWSSRFAFGPSHLDLAMEADGDFYIAWFGYSWSDCAGWSQVYMRGFNADGTPKYDLMRVTDTDSTWMCDGEWIQPSIDCDDSGNVLVVWSDARDYPGFNPWGYTPRNVYAQKIDPEGNLVGPNYRINNNLGNACYYGDNSMCDMNNAGQAIILWQNYLTPYRVTAQLMPYHDIGTFVPGDLNLDSKGNISDLTHLLTYLFGDQFDSISFWPKSLPDFNADGKSGNISDVCYMVSYLFGMPGGPAPHTPDAG